MIGAMKAEAPPDSRGDRGETVAMMLEPRRIIPADALDAADHHLVALLDALEAYTSVKGEVFFCRVDDLQQMALETGSGKSRHCGADRLERRQKVADENQLGKSRQRLKVGKTFPLGSLAADHLGNPRQRNPSAHRRHAAAEQREALPAADQKTRQREQQQLGAIKLCRPCRPRQVSC